MRPARRIEGDSQLAAAVGRSSANAGGVESEACDRQQDAEALDRKRCFGEETSASASDGPVPRKAGAASNLRRHSHCHLVDEF